MIFIFYSFLLILFWKKIFLPKLLGRPFWDKIFHEMNKYYSLYMIIVNLWDKCNNIYYIELSQNVDKIDLYKPKSAMLTRLAHYLNGNKYVKKREIKYFEYLLLNSSWNCLRKCNPKLSITFPYEIINSQKYKNILCKNVIFGGFLWVFCTFLMIRCVYY